MLRGPKRSKIEVVAPKEEEQEEEEQEEQEQEEQEQEQEEEKELPFYNFSNRMKICTLLDSEKPEKLK